VSPSSSKPVTLRLSAHGFDFDGAEAMPFSRAARDVKAAAAALAELPPQPGLADARLAVILDNAWTRFQVVRFPARVDAAEERQAFLAESFRRVFGPEAQAWTIAAEPAWFGLPVMAVAVDRTLMAALSEFAGRQRMRLGSVRPAFVDAFNRARPLMSGPQGAFAQIGGERVCIALWREQRWHAVRSQPIEAGARGAIGAMLAQMLANVDAPMASGTLYLACPEDAPREGDEQSLPEVLSAGWTATRLPVPTQ
jgi:hypothetical protein